MTRRTDLLTGATIAVVAAWAALWRLGTTTILFDEPTYAQAGRDHVSGDRVLNLEHPPLAKYGFGVAQWMLGDGITSARVASAVASVAIALVVWRLGTDLFGRAAGIVAAALWIALPRSIGSTEAGTPGDRLERFAYLEPITALWMVVAVWFGWRLHRHGRRLDALGLGVAVGLATASKISGVFVAIPIAVFLLLTTGRRMLVPLAAAGAVAVITFFTTYIPFGRTANEALDTMLELQRDHAETGHTVFVRGQSTSHPPWYTELWYHYDADGPWLTLATVVLVAIAFAAAGRRRAAGYLVGIIGGIYLLLSLLPVEIRHYRFVVWPPLVVLLAAGIVALAGPLARGWKVAGVGAVAVVAFTGLVSIARLATLQPEDYAALEAELAARSVPDDATVAVFGPVHVAAHHLPGHRVVAGADPSADEATVVLVDRTYTVRFGEPMIPGATESFADGRVTVYLTG